MSDTTQRFEHIEPDDAAYADYAGRFVSYNQALASWELQSFSKVLRQDGHIVAGGRGIVYLGALEIRGLWVDETHRHRGLGSDLMRAIEEEARARGASKAMLYTYSWQAKDFYIRHGYSEFARFDFPHGQHRIDMQKNL